MRNRDYAEMLEDDPGEARERERLALDRSIALMELAAAADANAAAVARAVAFASKLWTVLIEDLAAPSNGLPKELRAQIVSIGLFILRELESIRAGRSRSLADVIAVSKAIREGLL
jgi:flagellar protein FlaF